MMVSVLLRRPSGILDEFPTLPPTSPVAKPALPINAPLPINRRSTRGRQPSRISCLQEPIMSQNIYDNQAFFDGYAQLPRSQRGLDGAPEWAAIQAMLDLSGKR
jgi:hypothetical protein